MAVIGCGYWGKHLVRNFHHLGALVVVCELTPAGQQTAHALAPQATVISSVEAALATPVGVVIATPAWLAGALGVAGGATLPGDEWRAMTSPLP